MPPAPDAQGAPERVRIFGEVLATDRSLPGLPVAPTIGDGQFPFWELQTSDAPPAVATHSADATVLGRLEYPGAVAVSLAQRARGIEILVSDTGRFDLTAECNVISHHAPVGVDRAAVALDLIGVVLPMALHQRGAWCVHASAVRMGDAVIAFGAPRGTGKSTLAAACVQVGCTLVADDVVVLNATHAGITVTPTGVPLRLRPETARAVGAHSDDADAWGKVRIGGRVADETLPLAAIYLLQPLSGDAAIERVPRATRAAALALLAHGKITALLGGDAAGEALSRCVELAHRAAVYDLAIPRDLTRLHDVTAQLLEWHGVVPTATACAR
ncbi:MAG: hypothetical protein H7099_10960 [Gemmatimonadaceae bacterium]|nr:hypothetical protein [Gemmatimonadaceae bacterium]